MMYVGMNLWEMEGDVYLFHVVLVFTLLCTHMSHLPFQFMLFDYENDTDITKVGDRLFLIHRKYISKM